MACITCRKRKMRCDGNRPCAACQINSSNCGYATNSRSASRSDHSNNEPTGQQAYQPFSVAEPSSPSLVVTQHHLHNKNLSNDADLGFLDDINQGQFPSVLEEQVPLSRPNTAHSRENELPTSRESVFQSFMDTSTMNDIWQTPAFVGNTSLLSKWLLICIISEFSLLVRHVGLFLDR